MCSSTFRHLYRLIPLWPAAVTGLFLFSCRPGRDIEKSRTTADSLMGRQAALFLSRMPAGLQHRQATAVDRAVAGDSRELETVRSARNAPPQISKEVRVSTPAPKLRLYEPADRNSGPLPLLVYLHGGGWTFGSLNSCGAFCHAIAASGKIKVLAVDYRLAPEHPFPAGLNDCTAAIRQARSHAAAWGIDTTRITVGGDSSGGNLAIAAALSPECRNLIASLLLFYPVTLAYADGSASWDAYGKGYGLDAEIMLAFNRAYTGAEEARNPLISVGLNPESTLRKLPRTLLVAAGRDILRDQGKAFARKAGKRLTRIEFPEAVHLFITVPGQEKAFREAVNLSTDFITGNPIKQP